MGSGSLRWLVMWTALRRFLGEAGAARPPGPSPWDRWLVLALAPVVVLEGLLHPGLAHRPLHVVAGLGILGGLLFRRPAPLLATALGFGLATSVGFGLWALGLPNVSMHVNVAVLLLPYSLLRWGSARDVAVGLVILLAAYGSAALRGELHGLEEAVGAAVVMLFPGALGASARFRAEGHAREIEHTKLRERAELARDLHDTVAHHVAAIAVQAQAGRAVLASRPEATAATLEAIEKEAARTLSDLRGMVGALRDGDDGERAASRAPQPGLADLARLARHDARGLVVDVELEDGLEGLRTAVQTALFRIAQESITNALRHARGASRATVRVMSRPHGVRLTVEDDGSPAARRGSGFGLVGMAERAALLGGRLEAGPRDGGGWKVEVDLPEGGGNR